MSAILRLYAANISQVHEAVEIGNAHMHRKMMEFYSASSGEHGGPSGQNKYFTEKLDKYSKIAWYRGERKNNWKLEPTMYRVEIGNAEKRRLSRDEMVLAEEYRKQHFSARAYHKISEKPVESVEWQEVMQHHFVKTRLMDWSEQLNIGLLFALESFVADPDDERYKSRRWGASPVLWMLNPTLLNAKVYRKIRDSEKLIGDAVNEFIDHDAVKEYICEELRSGRGIHLDSYKYPLTNIVSLSQLEAKRRAMLARLPGAILSKEFDPFHYMLLRIYSDGVMSDEALPPLAAMHPYHSGRIEAQRGVFTIFPFPASNGEMISMNESSICDDCLCEIRLSDPDTLQAELRREGYGLSDLYPEIEVIGRRLEWM